MLNGFGIEQGLRSLLSLIKLKKMKSEGSSLLVLNKISVGSFTVFCISTQYTISQGLPTIIFSYIKGKSFLKHLLKRLLLKKITVF